MPEEGSHPTSETKGLPDSKNPLKKVNELHALFKLFMRLHGGYPREGAQSWCDLFAFACNHHIDRRSFVKDLILLAISTRKVTRCRQIIKKKPMNGWNLSYTWKIGIFEKQTFLHPFAPLKEIRFQLLYSPFVKRLFEHADEENGINSWIL